MQCPILGADFGIYQVETLCWIGFNKNLALLLVKLCTEPFFPVLFPSQTPSFLSGHSQSLFCQSDSPSWVCQGWKSTVTWIALITAILFFLMLFPGTSNVPSLFILLSQQKTGGFSFICLCGDFAACFSTNWSGWTQGQMWDFPAWHGTRTPNYSVCSKARASGPLVKKVIPACWMGPTVARTRQKTRCLLFSYSFCKKT